MVERLELENVARLELRVVIIKLESSTLYRVRFRILCNLFKASKEYQETNRG